MLHFYACVSRLPSLLLHLLIEVVNYDDCEVGG